MFFQNFNEYKNPTFTVSDRMWDFYIHILLSINFLQRICSLQKFVILLAWLGNIMGIILLLSNIQLEGEQSLVRC